MMGDEGEIQSIHTMNFNRSHLRSKSYGGQAKTLNYA